MNKVRSLSQWRQPWRDSDILGVGRAEERGHLGGFDDWGRLGCGLWRAFQWREQAGPGLTGKREGFSEGGAGWQGLR